MRTAIATARAEGEHGWRVLARAVGVWWGWSRANRVQTQM